MRIHTRPAHINFQTGEVIAHSVTLVGQAPHKTFFVEKPMGLVDDVRKAPGLVGRFLKDDAMQTTVDEMIAQGADPQQLQKLHAQGKIVARPLPEIPGVTAPGEWVNPRFGDPERHRLLHSIKEQTVSA